MTQLVFKEQYENVKSQLEEFQKKKKGNKPVSQNISDASSSNAGTSTRSNKQVI